MYLYISIYTIHTYTYYDPNDLHAFKRCATAWLFVAAFSMLMKKY